MKQSAFHGWVLLTCAVPICVLTASVSYAMHRENAIRQRLLPDATTWKYFPQASVNGLMPYAAEFLNSTDEPSLLTQAEDPSAVSYRFVALLFPGVYVRVIRFSPHGDGTATVVTYLEPYPKDSSAKIKPNKAERIVSAEEAAKFLEAVDGAGFWTMPTVEPPTPTRRKYYILDGSVWVFEGCRGGTYHVVYRPNPNASAFTDMVHFLGTDLAGLDEREIPPGMWPPIDPATNHRLSIQISSPVTAKRPFALQVMNRRSKPVYFCLASTGTIVPSPAWPVPAFDVQRLGPKKWGSLLWGSDLGPSDAPTELASGKTEEFRMKLIAPGRYRLRLYYVPRSLPDSPGADVCAKLDQLKSAKVVTSEEFDVLPE